MDIKNTPQQSVYKYFNRFVNWIE